MKEIIFWCEFPEKVNLNLLDKILTELNLKISVYIASKSLDEFNRLKNNFLKVKNIKTIGCWPILSRKNGYWYSGFTNKNSLSRILNFKGLKLKIDIEPPLEDEKFSYFSFKLWLIKYCFIKRARNIKLLSKVLKKLGYDNLIVSTFPLPRFMLSNLVDLKNVKNLNLMLYSSFIPKILRPLYRLYFKIIFESYKKMRKNIFVALGLIGKGVFKNEPEYKSVKEFKKDLRFVKKLGVSNIVIFELSGILKKKDSKEWLNCLK